MRYHTQPIFESEQEMHAWLKHQASLASNQVVELFEEQGVFKDRRYLSQSASQEATWNK